MKGYHCMSCNKIYNIETETWYTQEEAKELNLKGNYSSGVFSRECIEKYYNIMFPDQIINKEVFIESGLDLLIKKINDGELKKGCGEE